MNDKDLNRQLRRLQRSVVMLATELRNEHVDAELIKEIEGQIETLALQPGCETLRTRMDAVRESTLTPRKELMRDTVRLCEKLIDAIDAVVGRLG